jgi:hypothetical protein
MSAKTALVDEYLITVSKGMNSKTLLEMIGQHPHLHLVNHTDDVDRMCNKRPTCKGYDYIYLESNVV